MWTGLRGLSEGWPGEGQPEGQLAQHSEQGPNYGKPREGGSPGPGSQDGGDWEPRWWRGNNRETNGKQTGKQTHLKD